LSGILTEIAEYHEISKEDLLAQLFE
jgi:hypothetical protein